MRTDVLQQQLEMYLNQQHYQQVHYLVQYYVTVAQQQLWYLQQAELNHTLEQAHSL